MQIILFFIKFIIYMLIASILFDIGGDKDV